MAGVKPRPKSWRYVNTVNWTGARMGVLAADGKPDINVATPPDFGGHEGIWSPEDLFVAAVNCCIMTTFLYYGAKEHVELISYSSTGEGALEHGDDGLGFTLVRVKPEVVVASESDHKGAGRAIQRAEDTCLVSKSLRTKVVVEPHIQVARRQGRASEA